ncbi:SelB C-terminal domain-containing protein, partial [bacterium]|nr:SelB C-terminal domain-containing protein [bacterium]
RNKDRLQESMTGLASQDSSVRIAETVFLSGTKGIAADDLPPLVNCNNKQITKTLQKLASQGELVCINTERKKYLSQFHCNRITGFFVRTLKIFHKKNPEKPGAFGPDFFGKMSKMYAQQEILTMLNWAVKQKSISKTENYYHLPGFQGGLNEKQSNLKTLILDFLAKHRYQPPGIVNLTKELSLDQKETEKVLRIGLTEKWIIRVKDDLWYHPDTINEIKEKLMAHYSQQETLTVAEFKDLLGVSRKHAVGLLEYFDGLHLTRRMENHRILRLDIAEKE